ncbi:efflux RND transporter periplasmic adaptor subunit [Bowmanella sp. Y26]|uniref:efflux RND transporter periplasmic adaptor subunit n=1 Tax=Bowmanella yangjiangensis TaxID=2811230 RepID=UPI001BDD13C0|nr:efflux RND transporter periplasmic adaptor subunit [Bowmanella yangjiangensis]MBT1063202.1 efflux RND transporter periplasmic adaptor subunit [Bowmanella yangjiangensis]
MLRDTSGQDRMIQPKGLKRSWLIAGGVLLICVGTLVVTAPALSSLFGADMTIARERVRFAVVEQGDMQRDIAVQGRIVASNSPTLYARSGGIVSLFIKAGDKVEQGQLLASVDSPELDNNYAQELAVLEQLSIEVGRYQIQMKSEILNNRQAIEVSTVNMEAAQVNKHRAEISIRDALISQREFEEKVAEFKKAELAHKHAQQQFELDKESMEFELKGKESQLARQQYVVDNLKRQVDELQLLAPASGIIGSVNVREKDSVAANSPLITLIDLSAFEVEVAIPENYADDLGVGLASEIGLNGQQFAGEVVAISPEVNNGQVVGRIRFVGDNIDNLRQNQRVSARILIESRQNVVKVRRGAFLESGGGRVTYVVNGNVALRHAIEIGARSLAEVEVLSGLKPGDEIIISSLEEFNQQQQIYLAN